ncbi:hypothetical protein BJY04DRAFT_230244 [Aspergillus karnatakaensis]|uniref:uncharacterized protein n=1 Tax=Aspergillus karnatakaensis TaxID=1810916 RepID=UPI003CCCDFB9
MSEAHPDCPPGGTKIRFRAAPRPKQSFEFAADQKWVGSRRKRRLTYVDMTPRVARNSSQADTSNSRKQSTRTRSQDAAPYPKPATPPIPQIQNNTPASQDEYETHRSEQVERDPGIASRCRYPVGPLYGYSETYSDESYMDFQEACLTRHFIENLAPLFDASDMDRHFTIVVPERAVLCPVLRYAVYTASAGHLLRLADCRKESSGIVSLDGMQLPNLTPDMAMRYHDICIAHLIEISKDPREEYNEDVLTAATILRFYEQIDAPSIGNSEAYLNAIQFIVNTQKDEHFYCYQTIDGPPRDSSVHHTPSASLRHSACLAALRQEIWSAFLHQRPFRLPVSRQNNYSLCDPNNDFIRANRIFVWVAELLILCFGGSNHVTAQEKVQRWNMLKAVEQAWGEQRPPPLSPIYYRERDPSGGRFFPDVWYTNACQVAGAQHVELGRILLAVSDPTRTSRLGIGAVSRNHALAAELRSITRRLCGLALSNKKCPSAMITAMVAISVCGEYFTNPAEQDALLQLLYTLEHDYAWPTEGTVAALRASWAQNGIGS